MRDHIQEKITSFEGLYNCGEDVAVPKGYFRNCLNLEFLKRGFRTRTGSSLSLTLDNIRRVQIYRIAGQAQRLLILNDNGDIYDSTDLTTVILHIDNMTDFSSVTLFNRAYITPHNGITGLPGEFVYLYDGSGIARKAAGMAPSGFSLTAADDTTSGKVESGIHLIGVCYETDSGFLTKPGGFVSVTASGNKKLIVSDIGIGSGGIVARVLVSTKTIASFNGDFVNRTYFLVPNGRIPNNNDTTKTVDFYDADLLANANYLLEQLEEIPAGVCINGTSRSRMLVGGEDLHQSTVRSSAAGQPESFNAVEGFFNVNPGDAGSGVKNIFEHREIIIVSKSQRTYATVDNLEQAAFWKIINVDTSVGAEPHSIAKVMDYGQSVKDLVIIADRQGVHSFNGTFSLPSLTKNIDDYWKRINSIYFNQVELVLDPINYKIYAIVPLDNAVSPSHVLQGDYREGLDSENIKWSPWTFPVSPQSGVVDLDSDTNIPYFRFAGRDGNVYNMDTDIRDDFGTAIRTLADLSYIPHEESGSADGIYHFAGVRLRARGFGNVDVYAVGLDDTEEVSAGEIALSTAPGKEFFRLLNFKGERCSIRLEMTDSNEWMVVSKLTLLTKWLWAEYPT